MSGGIPHGGGLDRAIARFGGRPADWLDLSTGINPHAYPVGRIGSDAWQRLPSQAAMDGLLAAARAAYRVPQRLDIVAAAGAQSLIQLLSDILPGKSATIIAGANGTYGEPAHCCRKAGRKLRLAADIDGVALNESLVFLTRPNNPDGHVADRRAVLELCERVDFHGGIVVADESFCDAAPKTSLVADAPANLIILRSFGKFFGLAGLRLGFAVGSKSLVSAIASTLGPWPVSGPALEIGARALSDADWIASMRKQLEAESRALSASLRRAGLAIAGGTPLFVLARHEQALRIGEELARRQILVRTFEDRPKLLRFGLPPSAAAARRLERVVAEIVGALP